MKINPIDIIWEETTEKNNIETGHEDGVSVVKNIMEDMKKDIKVINSFRNVVVLILDIKGNEENWVTFV